LIKVSPIMANLEKLLHLAEQLNKQSDQVQEALTAVQRALAQLNLGVEAWITIELVDMRETSPDEQVEDFRRYTEIGYARVGRSWALAYKEYKVINADGQYDDPREEMIRLGELLSAPRTIRLQAAAKLPDLLEAIGTEAESLLTRSAAGLEGATEVLSRWASTDLTAIPESSTPYTRPDVPKMITPDTDPTKSRKRPVK